MTQLTLPVEGADAGSGGDDGVAPWIGSVELSRRLGQEHPPTPEQQAIIEAPLEPLLVIAGAGSGKTETMTARVVWLVANHLVLPEQVLGLTFTRKAAGELAERVTSRLATLASTGLWRPADGDELLGAPTVTTYHSYAGTIVSEHALRLGYERDSRLLSEAAAWQLAHEVVLSWDGPMSEVPWTEGTVTEIVLSLSGELAEHLREPEEMAEHLGELIARWQTVSDTAAGPRLKKFDEEIPPLVARRHLLPIVARYREVKRRRSVLDFSDQMALAARLARDVPQVGAQERERARVVLLDEFQDTSEAQLVLMRSLFAPDGHAVGSVTAVGDPHQSIYAWRGASATTLAAFAEQFDARQLALSTSWRNDQLVLDAANAVAADLRAGAAVPVATLAPRPGARPGRVQVARVATAVEEARLVAQHIADRRGGGRTAAVLCRKRSQFAPIVAALAEADLPYEVVGLGGLLLTSEVSDVVALLSVVQDPARGDRLMRLLTGPTCRLSGADIAGLGARARELSPTTGRSEGVDLAPDSADQVSIIDALEDLPPPGWQARGGESISEEGLTRLRRLSAIVLRLRGLTSLPLPDLIAEAERAIGVDIEVMARPGWSPGAARAHLDAFADVAAGFVASADRATLGGFIDWVEAAIARERGLDAPVVDPTPDAVQVLTCHAAKGLEWDVVAVPGLVEGTFPAHRARATPDKATGGYTMGAVKDRGWLAGTEGGLPYPLRGDAAGLPALRTTGSTPKEVVADIADFALAGGAQVITEERRLAYVALTRARHDLLLTSSLWAKGSTPRLPSRFLLEVAALDGVRVLGEVAVDAMPQQGESNPALAEVQSVLWPHVVPDPHRVDLAQAAALVRSADGSRAHADEQAWSGAHPYRELDSEVTVLLAERDASRQRPPAQVSVPAHLSTSQLVQLARDRDAFARDLRRPMPQPPQVASRRGSAFHAWIEAHYGQAAIFDIGDLPGSADEDGDDDELEAMCERFLRSPWAQRTPLEVELSLETVLDGQVIRGRVDAVFADEDGGVTVVDWKTGRPPSGPEASVRAVQLSAYALAYGRWSALTPDLVRGAFYYAPTGETVRPELLGEDELLALVRT